MYNRPNQKTNINKQKVKDTRHKQTNRQTKTITTEIDNMSINPALGSELQDNRIIQQFAKNGARVVELQFYIRRLTRINTVDQSFECSFNLRASYMG